MTNQPAASQDLSSLDKSLRDELYCIADSKLVLAGWYMIVLPNGRAISDWSALCAMMQGQYGQARALYQYIGRYGITREETEWTREAADIKSPKLLDTPPTSWSDFIVTAYLAEQAILTQLDSYRSFDADRTLSRLASKVHRESRFHHSYMAGWIKALRKDPGASVDRHFQQRFADMLDWWGDDSQPDPLFQAGYRDASEAQLRQRFIDSVSELFKVSDLDPPVANSSPGRAWKRSIRREGQGGIPASLFEVIRFKNIELALP